MAAGFFGGADRAALVLGAGRFGAPQVRILDALTMTELDSFFAFAAQLNGGVFVAAG